MIRWKMLAGLIMTLICIMMGIVDLWNLCTFVNTMGSVVLLQIHTLNSYAVSGMIAEALLHLWLATEAYRYAKKHR